MLRFTFRTSIESVAIGFYGDAKAARVPLPLALRYHLVFVFGKKRILGWDVCVLGASSVLACRISREVQDAQDRICIIIVFAPLTG